MLERTRPGVIPLLKVGDPVLKMHLCPVRRDLKPLPSDQMTTWFLGLQVGPKWGLVQWYNWLCKVVISPSAALREQTLGGISPRERLLAFSDSAVW